MNQIICIAGPTASGKTALAVELAKNAAAAGDIVTLSPACAAFDQFKNFAVRGKTFKEIVNSLT